MPLLTVLKSNYQEKGPAFDEAFPWTRYAYFFIVPPGDVASPFLFAAPAVPAPWVLASLPDGIALSFFISPPAAP